MKNQSNPPKDAWGWKKYFQRDAEKIASYNPCGGYQPNPQDSFKMPPTYRGLPEVKTKTPMPKVKPPKDERIPETIVDFMDELILKYERIYSLAIQNKYSPDEAKQHADNVVNQCLTLYIYHALPQEVEGEE